MIASLSIENYALIDKLSADFSDGFTVITGETGAGKSILLDALGLVLGRRADLSSLMDKERKCVIEAQFAIETYGLQSFFADLDWDYEPHTIIRREILPSGKSRAFVNDTPIGLSDLQELATRLIDVHSQHQTGELTETGFQFEILDAVAGHSETLKEYKQTLTTYKKTLSELTDAEQQKRDAVKEEDYNSFLLQELLDARLQDGMQQTLEADFEKLNNVEAIRSQLERAFSLADDEQFGLLHLLKEFKATLQKVSGFSKEYESLHERIQSVSIEFDDILSELNASAESLSNDPEQLERISQQLQSVYNLQKKHQVSTVAELIEIQNQLDEKAVSMAGLDNRIQQLESQKRELQSQLEELSAKISKGRKNALPGLTAQLTELLTKLGMPHVRFDVTLSESTEFLVNGKDNIAFLFSANKGADFGTLKKVASGGERSRIMLAIKYVLALHSKLPTIIFDEIDTGVSGEMADAMGEIMKGMSRHMQVFAITHLPQIAAKGDSHFKVSKTVAGGRTTSTLRLLETDARVVEIAQMLSGSAVSDSAINHARALLN